MMFNVSIDTMEKPAVAVSQDEPGKEEEDQTEKVVGKYEFDCKFFQIFMLYIKNHSHHRKNHRVNHNLKMPKKEPRKKKHNMKMTMARNMRISTMRMPMIIALSQPMLVVQRK